MIMKLRDHWLIDPEVTFLNHGSFGACPKEVLAYQSKLREEMEKELVLFIGREIEDRLDAARAKLAALVRVDSDDLVFVPNATSAVNMVLRSIDWSPGDEVLTTDHVYAACRNAIQELAEPRGAKLVAAQVPFPIASSDQVVESVRAAISERTKLILIDHVTSPT